MPVYVTSLRGTLRRMRVSESSEGVSVWSGQLMGGRWERIIRLPSTCRHVVLRYETEASTLSVSIALMVVLAGCWSHYCCSLLLPSRWRVRAWAWSAGARCGALPGVGHGPVDLARTALLTYGQRLPLLRHANSGDKLKWSASRPWQDSRLATNRSRHCAQTVTNGRASPAALSRHRQVSSKFN